jgi:putrescine transport system ATP-binding protein
MIRPEKMVVQSAPPPEGTNWVRGIVADIAYLGDVSIYHVALASGRRVEVLRTNLRHTGEQGVTWDDEVVLAWHPANALALTR